MSASDIIKYVQYPVIDGYVQLPPNLEGDKYKVSVDSYLQEGVEVGESRQTITIGHQKFVRVLPLS